MIDVKNIEMITCPRCGKPFPKKRKDLGYNYCIDCSTEKPLACVVEGHLSGDGDDTVECTVHVVSLEEAVRIEHTRFSRGRTVDVNESDEEAPNMRTIEDIDDSLEETVGFGMTERTERKFEEYCSNGREEENTIEE